MSDPREELDRVINMLDEKQVEKLTRIAANMLFEPPTAPASQKRLPKRTAPSLPNGNSLSWRK